MPWCNCLVGFWKICAWEISLKFGGDLQRGNHKMRIRIFDLLL